MSGLSGVLSLPASGEKARTRTRVDHRNSDEAILVRRVQAKDEIAFKEIVERYQSKVFSIIYGILRNHNDAEDIAQQVFAQETSSGVASRLGSLAVVGDWRYVVRYPQMIDTASCHIGFRCVWRAMA